MFAGANCLLRKIATCFLLVALAGIYAAPLAAAFAPSGMDCCATGMCPRPAHSHAQHKSSSAMASHTHMADCGMGSQTGAMRMCGMGACNNQRENVVRVAIFLLSAPVRVIESRVENSIWAQPAQLAHSISAIPDTPPPRTFLS